MDAKRQQEALDSLPAPAVLVLFALFVAAPMIWIVRWMDSTTPPAAVADAQVEARFQAADRAAGALRQAARDPASVAFSMVQVDDTGALVCLEYRARNGFGGMTLERAVSAYGRLSVRADDWNRQCAGQRLHDVTALVNARARP